MLDFTEVLKNSLKDILDSSSLEKVEDVLKSSIFDDFLIRPKHEFYGEEGVSKELAMYLSAKKTLGMSEGTIQQYKLLLTDFLKKIKVPLDKLTAEDIRLYLKERKSQRKVSDRTLDTNRIIIGSFLEWLSTERIIPSNPSKTVGKIKYTIKEKSPLDGVKLEKLRDGCIDLRERAIVEFSYSTGCRVSELCGVKITDLDLERGEVLLFGKGKKYRYAYINDCAKVHIEKYLNSRTDNCEYLFVSKRKNTHSLSKYGIEKIFTEMSSRLGFKVHPHLMRHTMATNCLARGASVNVVQKILGHSNINTTMIYAHSNKDQIKEEFRKTIF